MSDQNTITKKQLLSSGLICLVLAILVVVLFVLPAEYGEDPSGFGAATGLDNLAATDATPVEPAEVPLPETDGDYVFFDPADAEIPYDEWGSALPVYEGNNHQGQEDRFKTESVTVELDLDAMTEYKAIMNQGDVLLYSWKASDDVYTDFHAHQETGNPDFYTRYSESEGTEGHGAIVAPYSGQHGWFWLNLADGPTTIELTVSGYFDELIEIDLEADY